ncbi:hypothetical protein GQ457_03G032030 [Hibiscus cannabinus]
MMQRDSTGLTTENKELKMRLQAMEQQAKLRDGMYVFHHFCSTGGSIISEPNQSTIKYDGVALNDALRGLKIQAGQMSAMNGGLLPQSLPHQLWCPTDPRCLSHPPTTKLSMDCRKLASWILTTTLCFTLEEISFKLPSCT